MNARAILLPLAVAATLGLAACGDDEKDGGAAEHQATPAQAVAKIGKVRTGLDRALATYRSGDKSAAEQQVADAYLEHFELVEGPLGKVDRELNKKLEEAISTELRNKMKTGAAEADIAALVADVKRDLAAAEAKLK